MLQTIRVLLIEDDEDDYLLTQKLFLEIKHHHYQLDWATTYQTALDLMLKNEHQVYLVDYHLGAHAGLELIEAVVQKNIEAPIILLTGLDEYEMDMKAMAIGAQDYLVKGQLDANMLERSIRYAIERKQSEKILRRSRDTLRALMDASTEIMLLVEPDFTITTLNHATANYLHQSIHQLMGQSLLELFAEDNALLTELTQVTETGHPIRLQHQHKTYWFDTNIHPIYNKKGEITQIALFSNDITQRKATELTLHKSEELFRQVITSISDHIYVAHITAANGWQNIYHSPAVTTLTGYPLENFTHDWYFWQNHVIYPADRALALQQSRNLEQGQASETEYRIKHASGEILWIRDSARVEVKDGLKIVYGVVSNISSRKWSDETIREAYQRLTFYMMHSPLIVVEWDKTFRVLHWSLEATEIFGWSAIEVIGKTPFDWPFIPLADSQPFGQIIQGLLNGSWSHYVAITSHYTKSGQIIYCEWYISVLFDEKNQMTSILSLILDITERRRAEIALRAERASLAEKVKERTLELEVVNAELKRTARLKDEFLANMSHELRTPLNAILGMSEVLQEQIFGPVNERQLRQIKTIEESGQHLLNLINDILDLSKMEAGMFELHFHPVSLESLCDTSLQFVKQLALKKQITYQTNYDHKNMLVLVDELRLKQILVNLLTNAVKFTPHGGHIGLEFKLDLEQELIQFIVWDKGIGISESDMKYLFQPFIQLDSGLSRTQEGTGLGLYLVYQLIQLHGGSIQLESSVGTGSRFTIHLPLKPVTPLAPPPLSATPPPPPTFDQAMETLILLVEDNETNIQLINDYLTIFGYQLVFATSGFEAIIKAKETHPDLILMDIQMPHMNGFQATQQIRANAELAHTPIIALTALAMPGDCERCLAAGINEYLSKPINLRKLIELIRHYTS